MFFTHNTLPEAVRLQSVTLLNKHLAAAIDLHGQLKHAHWNVRGPGFMAVHALFDRVAAEAGAAADKIAERTGGLGGTALGTLSAAAERSYLMPYPLGIAETAEHIFAVSASLAAFSQAIRAASALSATAGDSDTADLFTEISRGIDQNLWFVESHAVPKLKPALSSAAA